MKNKITYQQLVQEIQAVFQPWKAKYFIKRIKNNIIYSELTNNMNIKYGIKKTPKVFFFMNLLLN